MTIHEWLKASQQQLEANGIGTARLDAILLLEDSLHINRATLLAEADQVISPVKIHNLNKLLKRRLTHEPMAYIRGHVEFFGRSFIISPGILVPRPESETMIELLKQYITENNGIHNQRHRALFHSNCIQVADVGCGCGALGVSAQLELPHIRVELLDNDQNAINTAQCNVDKFTLNINVILSDLLNQSQRNYDILLCNLPYVPDNYQINKAAMFEPKQAIFGGKDGLDLYRKLFKQVSKLHHKPLLILTESLPAQHLQLSDLALKYCYQLDCSEDFIQVFLAF